MSQAPIHSPNQPVQATASDPTDVMGIISIVLAFTGLQLIGFILGLVGASKAKKEGYSPVLSRVGWILNLIIGVIGFLLVVGVFLAIPMLQETQRNTQARSDLMRISSELQGFYANNRYYPATLLEVDIDSADLVDPNGVPYMYTPEPIGCVQCSEYTLQAEQEPGESKEGLLIRSTDY